MLSFSLLKNHAGILLFSDYLSLRALHETLHHVCEKSPLIRDPEGPLLELAYDVRKAYEEQREVIDAPEHYPEIGPRFGVKLLWPTVLVQCRILRASLGFFDSSKWNQASTYALEALLVDALDAAFPGEAMDIKEQWMRIDPAHPFAEEHLFSRVAQFCDWGKAERRLGLAGLLLSLDPMYSTLYSFAVKSGHTHLVDPAQLDTWNDLVCPDPKW